MINAIPGQARNDKPMKRINIAYWIVTCLFSAMMLFSGIVNAMVTPESVQLITDHLGYPKYFIALIGVAKVLGAIALLIPGWPRVKEWAYFGFFLDLAVATYSMIALGDPVSGWWPMLPFIAVLCASYFLHHKRLVNAAVK